MTPKEKAKELLNLFDDDINAAATCAAEIYKMAKFWEDVCPNMRSEQKYWHEVLIYLKH